MKKTLFTLSAAVLLFSCKKNDANPVTDEDVASLSAEGRQCAADDVLKKQIAEDPKRAQILEDIETKTALYLEQPQSLKRTTKVFVPVVVHVVLQNTSQVTDAQIQSQIDVLNADFNKTNVELTNSSVYLAGYPLSNVANCLIEYYVSSIVRKTTTVSSFGTNDAVKKSGSGGSDPVDPTTKLNMWVCDLSSGYLGYAQFPGGSASTDGVVIDYQAFGTFASYPMYAQFNKGRTATHEVGHWFNLRHIWGDRRCGNDYVSDTPGHDASNGGCPAVNLKSNCSGKPLEQWMNYMDYTDDKCMYMFSSGQKDRMNAAIASSTRANYVHY
ncbi:MAG: zinc metalloprotease [Flavisolibacter sp.]|jgi:hypothetical protein|nr:zinc metalloprotease [Flavisolibacter sp.]